MSVAEKLHTIAENQQKIYNAGHQEGYRKGLSDGGYDAGVESGKKAEYDRFWDAFQQNGNRSDYGNAFGGAGWTTENFKPKYDIRPTAGCFEMFRGNTMEIDLEAHLESVGVTLDFSGTIGSGSIFYNTRFTKIGVIDMSNFNDASYIFYSCSKLKEVVKIILKSDGSQTFTSWFGYCSMLEEIRFDGVIGKSGLNLQWSNNLSHDSLMSVINALEDKSADTSGTSWVVTIGETNRAKMSEEEIDIAEAKGWEVK